MNLVLMLPASLWLFMFIIIKLKKKKKVYVAKKNYILVV